MQSVSGEGVNLDPQGGGGGAAKADERKVEKTAFSVKLEKYDASAKITVIKEVRAFTNLGLKEAKDLVKKVPTMLKQGILKEEANEINREDKGCWWSCSYGVNSSNLFGILGSLLEEI